jgi:hypothetical protein
MHHSFSITYDYLCPFARNANETIVEAIRGGADLDVVFVPYSLREAHATEEETAQWDLPCGQLGAGVLALLWSVAVRDNHPDSFMDFHVAMFSARHDDGADINNENVIRGVVEAVGLNARTLHDHVASGVPAQVLADEHTSAVEVHGVFGVPTFMQGDDAVFVRFMDRHEVRDLEKVLEMLSWENLNEFKRTAIDR